MGFFIVTVLFLVIFFQLNKSLNRSAQIDLIVQDSFDLNTLSLDFFLHPSERSKQQWLEKHKILKEHLTKIISTNNQDQIYFGRLHRTHRDLINIFPWVSDNLIKNSSGAGHLNYSERFTNQILIKTHLIASTAKRLSELNKQKMFRSLKKLGALILSVGSLLFIVSILVSYYLQSSIIKSLKKLYETSKKITQGNLNVKTNITSHDELGHLSKTFDNMIESLKNTTVKKEKLENEIQSHKITLKKLQQSELKFRSMIEQMSDPVYICSPDRKIEYMNPSMTKLIGRNAVGEICYQVFHQSQKPCKLCAFDKIKKGITLESKNNLSLKQKKFRVTNMPMVNPTGLISKMSILRDITDFLKAVEEKKKAEQQLYEANKMEAIGNLAGGIAHDFNNILSSIIGFSEIALSSVKENPELHDDLLEINTAGKRAAELVKQILIFARKTDEEVKPIEIEPVATEAISLLKSTIPSNIEIIDHLNSNNIIIANETRIHQVFMNLCTNASHSMERKGGKLIISVADINLNYEMGSHLSLPSGNYVKIEISDTGMGIPHNIIDSIFEPYFSTKQIGKGTGLGLATVHGIVEKYSGKIQVASEYGKGTTFTIFLPGKRGQKSIAIDSYKNESFMGSEVILLVDDEKSITKMNRKFLENLGYTIIESNDSLEALTIFNKDPDYFDLIVSDMTMPNMTGDSLANEMLKTRPGLPIILCTGYSKIVSKEKALNMGIRAYIEKPIDTQKLSKIIREIFDTN